MLELQKVYSNTCLSATIMTTPCHHHHQSNSWNTESNSTVEGPSAASVERNNDGRPANDSGPAVSARRRRVWRLVTTVTSRCDVAELRDISFRAGKTGRRPAGTSLCTRSQGPVAGDNIGYESVMTQCCTRTQQQKNVATRLIRRHCLVHLPSLLGRRLSSSPSWSFLSASITWSSPPAPSTGIHSICSTLISSSPVPWISFVPPADVVDKTISRSQFRVSTLRPIGQSRHRWKKVTSIYILQYIPIDSVKSLHLNGKSIVCIKI